MRATGLPGGQGGPGDSGQLGAHASPRGDAVLRLSRATLMLVFTPELCGERPPLEVLEAALPEVDAIQVRVKLSGRTGGPSPARELFDWTVRVLDLFAAHPSYEPPVIVNDRVDVALALAPRGCAGVHLGTEDCPPREARELLGPRACIGLSTHTVHEVAAAGELPVDYLGFGPIHATATKGYETGLGPEAAWIAQTATALPLFPIGGIDLARAGELTPVGRAAVGSAILGAADPRAAARALRAALQERD